MEFKRPIDWTPNPNIMKKVQEKLKSNNELRKKIDSIQEKSKEY